jgi:TonB family protein
MNLRVLLGCLLCLALFAPTGCGRKSTGQVVGEASAQPSPSIPPVTTVNRLPTPLASTTPSPEAKASQRPSSDLAKLESRVRPSVILVTVFDPSGNLLRTQSGFFISADGRLATTARAIEGGINAVAKTADGGIYNVNGILVASKALDLAVLQADVKPRKLLRFLELHKDADLTVGTGVAVLGSGLAGSEGSPHEMTITAQDSDHLEIAGTTPVSSIGAPVVNENGDVIGVVTSPGEKTIARSSVALDSLLSRISADTQAHWPATAETRATPGPTPKPRLIYAPAPAFPPQASRPGVSGTGRFRLTFDANGNVTNVQVIQSTGNRLFDDAATRTLRQWRSSPGQGWVVTVPVTFQTR